MTPGAAAICRAGLTEQEVCRRARVCPRYLRRILRHGTPYYHTAERLARVVGCPITAFQRPPEGGETPARVGVGARRGRGPGPRRGGGAK